MYSGKISYLFYIFPQLWVGKFKFPDSFNYLTFNEIWNSEHGSNWTITGKPALAVNKLNLYKGSYLTFKLSIW